MKNEQLIEALKPVLDAVLELDGCPHVNDVQITITKDKEPGAGYVLEFSAWARTHHHTAPDLESLAQVVRDYDPNAAEKNCKRARVEAIKTELLELETELNQTTKFDENNT